MINRIRFLASWAWDFLRPLVGLLLTAGGRELAEIAQQVVAELEELHFMTGAQKRAHAVKVIRDELERRGYAFATAVIHMAIEAALLRLRAED